MATSVEFDSKGGATGARLFRLWVGQHPESRPNQLLVIVQCCSGTVVHRYRVHHHSSVVRSKDNVVRENLFVEIEFVLEPGASTTFHRNPQEAAVIA